MQISEKIKLLRTDNNLTQSELAKKLNVSSQAVSNWERGKGYPDISNIIVISDLFKVSLDELIKDDIDFKEILVEGKFEKTLDIIMNTIFICVGAMALLWQIKIFFDKGFDKISIFILAVSIFLIIDGAVFFIKRKK